MTKIAVNRNILNSYASTAVAVSGGQLSVTGVNNLPTNQIQSAEWVAGYSGFGAQYLLTSTIANAKFYSFNISQRDGNYIRTANISYTSTSATAATEYAAILALVISNCAAAGITFGATPTSSGSGVVIIGTPEKPFFEVNSLTSGTEAVVATQQARTLTAAGSTISNAAPRVLTAGAAHGLVVGGLYKLKISGVTGSGGEVEVNTTLYFVPTTATAGLLLNTTAAGAVVSTSATIEVLPVGKQDLVNLFGSDTFVSNKIADFNSATNYLVLSVQYIVNEPQDTKPNPICLANQTGFNVADADMNAVFVAANSALANYLISAVPA